MLSRPSHPVCRAIGRSGAKEPRSSLTCHNTRCPVLRLVAQVYRTSANMRTLWPSPTTAVAQEHRYACSLDHEVKVLRVIGRIQLDDVSTYLRCQSDKGNDLFVSSSTW